MLYVTDLSWLDRLPSLFGAGAVGGLLVGEINRRIARSSEKRKSLGSALRDLLEIRSYLLATKLMKKEIRRLAGTDELPPQASAVVYVLMKRLNPVDWGSLQKRYAQSIETLSGIRPVLAYELGSRDSAIPILEKLGSFAVADSNFAEVWKVLDKVVDKQGLSRLDRTILFVARKHGLTTWRDAKKALKVQDSMADDADLRETFDQLKIVVENLEKASAAAAAASGGVGGPATSSPSSPTP
jgi:hypothetical protein